MSISREQFTHLDSYLHPECDNKEHLEYERVNGDVMGQGEIVAYGYKALYDIGLGGICHYIWIPLNSLVLVQEVEKQNEPG